MLVAIDGTAGSGKSTTARLAARRLGFYHLDTGAMYRAVTLQVLDEQVDFRQPDQLAALLARSRIELETVDGNLQVRLNGRDVTEAIRQPAVDALVSEVAAVPDLRLWMVRQQRALAAGRDAVCEGRDIGTVVFPDADLKFFLDCDLAERAARRDRELAARGSRVSGDAVAGNLRSRDERDRTRAASPLRPAPDAIRLDTTHLTIAEEVDFVVARVRRLQAARAGSR